MNFSGKTRAAASPWYAQTSPAEQPVFPPPAESFASPSLVLEGDSPPPRREPSAEEALPMPSPLECHSRVITGGQDAISRANEGLTREAEGSYTPHVHYHPHDSSAWLPPDSAMNSPVRLKRSKSAAFPTNDGSVEMRGGGSRIQIDVARMRRNARARMRNARPSGRHASVPKIVPEVRDNPLDASPADPLPCVDSALAPPRMYRSAPKRTTGSFGEEPPVANDGPDSMPAASLNLAGESAKSDVVLYRIPAWDQFVVEYLFPGAFRKDIDYSEFFAIAVQFGSLLLNAAMVGINVFYNDNEHPQEIFRILSLVIFIGELSIVWSSLLFLLVVVIHGLASRNVGTNFVVDVVELTTFTASFSSLKCLSYASPSRMIRVLGERVLSAYDCLDYAGIAAIVLLWVIAFLVSTCVLVLKISQVDFIFSGDISLWDWMEFAQLFGLVNNLSGIDLSNASRIETLIDCLHKHHCGPGGPTSPSICADGLYTRLKRCLGVSYISRNYEFIECVFDSNFSFGKSTASEKAMHVLNFMAFIFKMDAAKLEQLLQMTRSPLAHYAEQRRLFTTAMQNGDADGMLAAVARADPSSKDVSNADGLDSRFRLVYSCDVEKPQP